MKHWIVLVAALMALTAPLGAQGSESGAAQKKDSDQAALADPTQTALAQKDDQQITLEATEEGSNLVGRFGFEVSDNWIFNLKLKAPVQKGEAALANLDGLAGGTVGTVSLTRKFYRPSASRTGLLLEVCKDFNETRWSAIREQRPDWRRIDIANHECTAAELKGRGEVWKEKAEEAEWTVDVELEAEIVKACMAFNQGSSADRLWVEPYWGQELPPGYKAPCSKEALASVIGEGAWAEATQLLEAARQEKLDRLLGPICETYNDPPVADLIDLAVGECNYLGLKTKGHGWGRRALKALPFRPWYTTLEASASSQSFGFVDPETLEKKTASKENSSFSAAVGTLSGGTYYSLAFSRQKLHKGAAKTELCRPFGDTGALTCSDTAIGGPTRVDKEIVRLEAKRFLKSSVGANLRLLYDTRDDIFNPHLLFFFLQHKTKGLNGGIDLSYEDKKDEFTARVFVGTAFEFFPGAS